MAACALLMWLLAFPSLAFTLPWRELYAGFFILAALGIGVEALVRFRRAKTTVNPLKPEQASALVVGGIYRWTRNPMYLGMLLLLVGWAFILSSWAALAILPLFVIYLNRFQIGPEERALRARFGAEFDHYRERVRRWL
jgi:protein-S-isoprenylcysteine O-methyltransferase Ste14